MMSWQVCDAVKTRKPHIVQAENAWHPVIDLVEAKALRSKGKVAMTCDWTFFMSFNGKLFAFSHLLTSSTLTAKCIGRAQLHEVDVAMQKIAWPVFRFCIPAQTWYVTGFGSKEC